MDQRVNIRLCYKLGKNVTETHEMLVQVYGTNAVNKKCVYEWFKRFRKGKATIEDEPPWGRPWTNRTPNIIGSLQDLLPRDRPLILWLIAEEMGIIKATVHTIISEGLDKRKMFPVCISQADRGTESQAVEASGDFTTICDQVPSFLRSIITGSEWNLVLLVRSVIQAAVDGMAFLSPTFPQESFANVRGEDDVDSLLRQQ